MLPLQTDLDNDKLLLRLFLARITFLTLEEKKKFANLIDSTSKLALCSIEELEKLVGRSFSKRVVWNGAENLRCAKAALYRCDGVEGCSSGVVVLKESDASLCALVIIDYDVLHSVSERRFYRRGILRVN